MTDVDKAQTGPVATRVTDGQRVNAKAGTVYASGEPEGTMRTALRLGLFGLCCLWFRVQAKGAEEVDPSSSASPAAAVPDDSVRRAQAPARPPTPPPPSPVRPAGPVAPTPVPPAPPSAPPALSLAPGLFGPAPEFGPPAGAGWPQAGLTSLGSFSEAGIPQMLGDQAPMFGTPKGAVPPWVRGYKMADNQSPRPQDRLFVAFNFYDNLRQSPTSELREVKVYREFFGFEKTFFDGNASLGMRVPLNTLSASGVGRGGTSTAFGDLTVFLKEILLQDREAGFLLSGGLAVTPPTGPSNFAGAPFARSIATTSLQPFLGYIWSSGRWFLQGFSGINVPTDPRVVTMYYNDIGIGYFFFAPRTRGPGSSRSCPHSRSM